MNEEMAIAIRERAWILPRLGELAATINTKKFEVEKAELWDLALKEKDKMEEEMKLRELTEWSMAIQKVSGGILIEVSHGIDGKTNCAFFTRINLE